MGKIESIEYPSLYMSSDNSNLFSTYGLPKVLNYNYYQSIQDFVKSIGISPSSNDIIENVEYDPDTGLARKITFSGGLGSIYYSYDQHNRLLGIEGYLGLESIFRQLNMQYDSSGNLKYFHNENVLPNPPISIIIGSRLPIRKVCIEQWKNYNAYYDGLGRLVKYRRQSQYKPSLECPLQSSYIEREWTYDDFGNITGIETKNNDGPLSSITFDVDPNTNRLKGSYIYDYRGNIIKEIKADNKNYMYYYYSPESQLNIGLEEESNIITYQHLFGYDTDGLRIIDGKRWIVPQVPECNPNLCWCASASGGDWAQETVYIRDEEGNVLAEFDRDIVGGSVQWEWRRYNYFIFGNMVSAEGMLDDQNGDGIMEWGKRYYYHDHLGSIRALIDGQANYLANYEYWPYGEEMTSSTFNEDSYRYTGHERDYDLEMDYMKSRHYKYKIGRFHQPDPVNGLVENPMSWNLYTYVQNNPLNYIDPFGLSKKGKAFSIVSSQCSTPEEEQEIKKIECQMEGGTWEFGTCVYDFGFGETVTVIGKAVTATEDIGFIADWFSFLAWALQPSMHKSPDVSNLRNFTLFAFGKGKFPFNIRPDKMQEVWRLLPGNYPKPITNMPGQPLKPINPNNSITKEGMFLMNLWKLIINFLKTREFIIPVIFVPTPEMIYLYDKKELKL